MCFFSKFTGPFCALRIRYIFSLQTGKNIAAHSWAAKTERVSLELFVRGAPTAARAAPVVRSSLSGEVSALPGHLFLTWLMIPEPPCRMIDNLGTSCEPFVNPKTATYRGGPPGHPGRPPHQTSCWLDRPKLTAMAPSTFFITCSSTRPICSRSRRLSRVRICSNSTMESLGRP